MVGLRCARATRGKQRTCFGKRRDDKKQKRIQSRSWRSRMVVVAGILSDCLIAFVNPVVSPWFWIGQGLCCLAVVRLTASWGVDCLIACSSVAVCVSVGPDSCLSV